METNNYQKSFSDQPVYYDQQTGSVPVNSNLEEPVTMKEWALTFLILMIPCVNIVMLFVWAFSSTEKKSKSNFFKVQLIFAGIVFAIYILLVIIIFAAVMFAGIASSY